MHRYFFKINMADQDQDQIPEEEQAPDVELPKEDSEFFAEVKKGEDIVLSDKEQEKLGEPIKDESAVSKMHENYFKEVVDLLEKGDIDVDVPESLLNKEHYDSLDEEKKGHVDQATPNLCMYLRQIKTLCDNKQQESFQMTNLIESVWQAKENVENDVGDVYKI